MKKREELTEDLEIQKELETDDISPIQDRVDNLFDETENAVIENTKVDPYVRSSLEELLNEMTDNEYKPEYISEMAARILKLLEI